MPEMVYLWNNNYVRDQFQNKKGMDKILVQTVTESSPMEVQVNLNIPTMGCVACIQKIDATVRRTIPQRNMISNTSWLDPNRVKGGKCSIRLKLVDQDDDVMSIVDTIIQEVKNAGFNTCQLESVSYGEGV
jgi:hypothetical protein